MIKIVKHYKEKKKQTFNKKQATDKNNTLLLSSVFFFSHDYSFSFKQINHGSVFGHI